MSRHRPTAAELDELRAAWNAYRDDEANYDRLAEAVRIVLGYGPSPLRAMLDAATMVPITELSKVDRDFGDPEPSR